MIDDANAWSQCPAEWVWIYDKLVIAQRQGILSGPAGVPVTEPGWYIIRPITNIRMMGRGAHRIYLQPGNEDVVPDGYFWSEILVGDHVSVDYHWGRQTLAVLGEKGDPTRYDRFNCWRKISGIFELPGFLVELGRHAEWVNVEYINGLAIEVHLRYNDDFAGHDADVIYPVWRGQPLAQPMGTEWYDSPCADRLGFWVQGTVSYK
jgi:hypothetical protein